MNFSIALGFLYKEMEVYRYTRGETKPKFGKCTKNKREITLSVISLGGGGCLTKFEPQLSFSYSVGI